MSNFWSGRTFLESWICFHDHSCRLTTHCTAWCPARHSVVARNSAIMRNACQSWILIFWRGCVWTGSRSFRVAIDNSLHIGGLGWSSEPLNLKEMRFPSCHGKTQAQISLTLQHLLSSLSTISLLFRSVTFHCLGFPPRRFRMHNSLFAISSTCICTSAPLLRRWCLTVWFHCFHR
jgi:hypothetical protein